MILAITGTQTGWPQADVDAACEQLPADISNLVTGGCIGIDEQVARWFQQHRPEVKQVIILPSRPKANASKRASYARTHDEVGVVPGDELARNRYMVSAADELAAFPKNPQEVRRSGTWATVREARRRACPVRIMKRK